MFAPPSRSNAGIDGRTLGVLGGGQLGRMMAEAGHRLGIAVLPLETTGLASPAGQVAGQAVTGSFKDPEKIRELASKVNLITAEIEHVDCDALDALVKEGVEVQPSPDTIRLIQDKLVQKKHFEAHGVALGPFMDTPDEDAMRKAGDTFGYPFMLKARKGAYDGKGNAVVESAEGIPGACASLGGQACYAEKWCPFEKEVAVMVVRNRSGDTRSYPVVDFTAKNSICHTTICPAASPPAAQERVREVATQAIRSLGSGASGIFGVELFLFSDGSVTLNEVAPRPHNSGHYTMEACGCDQFEAHVRAVMGLPLPDDTGLRVGAALMINVVSQVTEPTAATPAAEFARLCSVKGAGGHWYGKASASRGRKMAHVTVCAPSVGELVERLAPVADLVGIGMPKAPPHVGVIMGSDSDLPCMKEACDALREFGVPYECTVVSAHRTPDRMFDYARTAAARGLRCIIAGAGGAAHLPGMVAALSPLPVVGVPCVPPTAKGLDGIDAALSILQMPTGVPVATVAIGNATNAGLLAARIVGAGDAAVRRRVERRADDSEAAVLAKAERLAREGWESAL